MKAVIIEGPCSPGDMKVVEDQPMPSIEPGHVRVRVHACGLNPVDYKIGGSNVPSFYPFILGLDGSGVIESVGDSDGSGWKVGDEVYWHGNLKRNGAFAEYCVTKASAIARKPSTLSFSEAASIPCAGFTAYQAVITKLDVKKDQAIFISGGAGGVGSFAIQLAKLRGANPIITTTSKSPDYLKKLGATHVINYTTENVAERILEITNGRGVIGFIDTVSDESVADLINSDCIAANGGICPLASLQHNMFGQFPGLEQKLFSRQISLHFVALGPAAYFFNDVHAEHQLRDVAQDMGRMYDDGELNKELLAIEEVKMEGVADGLERIKGRHVTGKIVMVL